MTEEARKDEGYSDAFAEAAGKKAAMVDDHETGNPPAGAAADGEGDDAGAEGEQGVDNDPYAGLAPEVAERLRTLETEKQQLEHRLKSDGGRVAAYQRQVNELNEKLRQAINAGQRQAERGGSDAEKPDMAAVADAMQDEDSWANFSEEYPEIAAAIEKRLQSVEQTVTKRIAPVEKLAVDAELNKGYEYLDQKFDGWRDRVSSEAYQEWIEAQPDVVKKWADSDNVNDAASLIQYFDNYLLATGRMSEFKQTAGKAPQDGEDSGKADALARKRQQQLEDGDAIDSRGAGVGASDGSPAGEFGAAFAAFAKRKERERQRA